ncbi:hypothetical protein IAT38_001739 [Cryptococcus sp. DSM 104549]
MASASGYNHHRFARAVLKKSRKWEPSLTVQLFQTSWRFENSPVNFQYDGPMRPFLLAIRSQVIPSSLIPFLYDIQPPVSFVDGCLVVELQDFRRSPETRSRVVMRPAAETLAQTIDVMLERKGQSWDERMALELESKIIAATSPPLYLGTSILATRNATLAINLTTPAHPNLTADGTLRVPSAPDTSDAQSSLDRMRKLILAGSPAGMGGVPAQPSFNVLRAMEAWQLKERNRQRGVVEGVEGIGPGAGGSSAGGAGGPGGGPGEQGEKKKSKKKRPAGEDGEEEKPKPKKKKKAAAPAAAGTPADAETPEGGEAKKKPAAKKAGGAGDKPTKKKAAKKKEE